MTRFVESARSSAIAHSLGESLAPLTTFKLGGPADVLLTLIEPKTSSVP